jgi:hypothetical protein
LKKTTRIRTTVDTGRQQLSGRSATSDYLGTPD